MAISGITTDDLIQVGPCLFRADEPSRETLLSGGWERDERFACQKYVPRDLPVVELGGSPGVTACLLNRRLRNPDQHVVVEANPELLPILTENRDRNRCKFEILHGIAGAEGNTARIYIGDGALWSSTLVVTAKPVDVPVTGLAQILESRSFARCSVVCDIEGAEVDLIRAEFRTLRAQVSLFIVEFHRHMYGAMPIEMSRRLLKDQGFEEVWSRRDVFVFRNTALPGTFCA